MKRKRLIVRILSLLVLIGCVFYIVNYFYDINKSEDKVNHLREIVNDQVEADTVVSEENQEKEILTYMDNGMLSKYYPLYQMNNDMCGWIKIRGTNIDYPVLYKNNDNSYYMKRGFDGEKQSSGAIFLDYECNFNDSDNFIVYGHNMRAGTMFAELLKYDSKEFFNNNGYISFDNLYHTGVYRVIGAFYARKKDDFRYYEFIKAKSADEFDAYVQRVKNLSLYDTGENAQYGDKLLTLSTCSYNTNDERFVVVAKRIEEK